jgi:hypothetical protein
MPLFLFVFCKTFISFTFSPRTEECGYASFSNICGVWLVWVWVWVWDWIHALLFFSPPSFHTLAFSPAFTRVWWSA